MNRFSSLINRLRKLEPEPDIVEQWPPLEGSLEWAILESMKAEGIEIPEKPANELGLMFLIKAGASGWFSEAAEDVEA